MTTITIGSSRSYTENVARTARDLFVALFALPTPKAAARQHTKKLSAPINPSLFDAYADVFNLPSKSLTTSTHPSPKRGSALVPYAHWSASWYYDKN